MEHKTITSEPRISALSLPVALRCPLCGNSLTVDPCWVSPHWLCPRGHGYSNLSVLIAELRARGWLSEDVDEFDGAYSRSTSVLQAAS